MGAPKKNKFWELRSKHGRDKLFKSPELMWKAATEYFTWCEQNPLIEVEPKVTSIGNNAGSEVEMVEIPKMRPFTLHGLCLYLNCNIAYFRNFKNQHRKNAKDFSSVIEQIEEVIYNQQFSGAAAGFLKENIIARSLGLKDHQEQTGSINVIRVVRE